MQVFSRYIFLFPCLIVVIVTAESCKKFIEVGPPKNSITTETVFSNDQAAMAAVDGIYSSMANGAFGETTFASGQLTLLCGLSSDELQLFTPNAILAQFAANNIATNNSTLRGLWSQGYSYIYQANACLASLDGNPNISAVTRDRLTGECKFIRAYCYLNLLQLLENIPLITSIRYQETANQTNASKQEVFQVIIQDLKDAQQLLGDVYFEDEKARPNLWSANALLARAYLYEGTWAEAATAATSVIDGNGAPELNIALSNCFRKNNDEAIWQLAPGIAERNTPEGYALIPLEVPTYIITQELLGAFEPLDKRRSDWVGEINYLGTDYYFPFKYKLKAGPEGNEYTTLLRLAEQFLIRAEARARLEDFIGATADVNVIRLRAGLEPLEVFPDIAASLAAIEHERRVELFAEHGHRWIDLVRTDRASAVLSPLKEGWQPTDRLYPLPLNEIRNSFLKQNPGYN